MRVCGSAAHRRRSLDNDRFSLQALIDQKIHRHAQRAGEFLLQSSRPFAATSFDLRQIILAYADRDGEFALGHLAPITDDTYRTVAAGKAIGYGFRQHDFTAFLDGTRGIADDPARSGIFLRIGREGDQPVIIGARQYGEIPAIGSVDELDVAFDRAGFSHCMLSVVNVAAVSDRVNCDRVSLDREQDPPVPERNRIPDTPLSAFTSPTPVSANAFNLRSICARVLAVSLRHWRTAAEVNSMSFTSWLSHNAINKPSEKSRNAMY
jgi:hypothetical protein